MELNLLDNSTGPTWHTSGYILDISMAILQDISITDSLAWDCDNSIASVL